MNAPARARSADPAEPGAVAPRWLTLVGIGEDGIEGLSHAGRAAIAQAQLIVGGRRHLALLGATAAESMAWRSPIESTFPDILARRPSPVCVLASGDPFHFGVGSLLATFVPPREMAVFPQPSAFSLAAARLGWPLQACDLLSLCGRPVPTVVPHLRHGARLLILSADAGTPPALAETLCGSGFGASRLTVCEALGGRRERVRTARAQGFGLRDIDPLNTVAVEAVGPARVPGRASLVPGRPDEGFANDGQITKRDIRALTLGRLAPGRGETLWDVGAGSGSVAIEWLLAHPANRAYAIEARADRASRIRANAREHGVAGLTVVEGTAPESLEGLPRPDAVFVGGGATTPGLLDACREALSPGGRLVLNAVTLETEAAALAGFQAFGGELLRVAVAHAEALGRLHGWRPAMPVTQWSWVKP